VVHEELMLQLLLSAQKFSEHVLICLLYIFVVVHEAGILRVVAWLRLTPLGSITTALFA
jgi:hypothetical protein